MQLYKAKDPKDGPKAELRVHSHQRSPADGVRKAAEVDLPNKNFQKPDYAGSVYFILTTIRVKISYCGGNRRFLSHNMYFGGFFYFSVL